MRAETSRLSARGVLDRSLRAFYERDVFWSIYGGIEYARLKGSYDPEGRLKGLYEKVVERQ